MKFTNVMQFPKANNHEFPSNLITQFGNSCEAVEVQDGRKVQTTDHRGLRKSNKEFRHISKCGEN